MPVVNAENLVKPDFFGQCLLFPFSLSPPQKSNCEGFDLFEDVCEFESHFLYQTPGTAADSLCKLFLDDKQQKQATQVVKKSQSPVWNKSFLL